METTISAWVMMGVRVLLKRAIAKGLRDDGRPDPFFNSMTTENLLTFARNNFRQEVGVECAKWVRAGMCRWEKASQTTDDADLLRKAHAESDLMLQQANTLLDLMEK